MSDISWHNNSGVSCRTYDGRGWLLQLPCGCSMTEYGNLYTHLLAGQCHTWLYSGWSQAELVRWGVAPIQTLLASRLCLLKMLDVLLLPFDFELVPHNFKAIEHMVPPTMPLCIDLERSAPEIANSSPDGNTLGLLTRDTANSQMLYS